MRTPPWVPAMGVGLLLSGLVLPAGAASLEAQVKKLRTEIRVASGGRSANRSRQTWPRQWSGGVSLPPSSRSGR
jgi:hypothetical protein